MGQTKVVRWLPWLLGLAMLAAVVFLAQHFSQARDFARLAERAEPWWLLLALALQAGTYVALAQVFRVVARAGGATLALGTACRLGLIKLFVDKALPSAGLSGTAVLATGLQRRGMPRALVAAAIVVELVSYYAAYVVCLLIALVIAATHGEANRLVAIVTLVFVLFAAGLSGLVLALSGRHQLHVPQRLAKLAPVRSALDFIEAADVRIARAPALLFVTSLYQIAIVLCDASTVWVLLRSLGGEAAPSGVFASFMISSMVRTIGIVPGALGTFEATSVLTLRAVGVPFALGLSATLLFRALSLWLPMLPGLWFSRREMV